MHFSTKRISGSFPSLLPDLSLVTVKNINYGKFIQHVVCAERERGGNSHGKVAY